MVANESSIKCYEQAGFKKTKLIGNARKIDNNYWNLYEMDITREEWQNRV